MTQFGFRALHSCPQQLDRVVSKILDTYEEKKVCLGLFIDTEKAFDKVWHAGLLAKLKGILDDTLFLIIRSYLSDRTYSVRYGDALSRPHGVSASVPQGSVIGPVLYVIFSSDFPSDTELTIAHFADDVAILSKQANCRLAAEELQRMTARIDDWCKKWRVRVNPTKSNVVRFTYLRKVTDETIQLQGTAVPVSTSVRYLGLHLDQRLTWNEHVSQVISKMRNRIRALKHLLSSESMSIHIKRLMYLTLIRPIWQFGCAIWSSASDSQIKRVQTLQNRVLRIITGAPWYIRNKNLHRDLDVPEVSEVLRETCCKHQSTIMAHPNDLLRSIAEDPPPPRADRRLKRKRHSDLAVTQHTSPHN
ncbi:Reverse transcriptase (RNA-dependent DNA polymerase) [Nesidiocoris tenuis]|uniref:Reverse transcriptase (RNA-dependent DNA polymerase) n=1 Tax=Nesidiocoris tenuis TaxID=355587 RepID=A0ABN7B5L1_9HEMI|nr:Reverse transcriptase (RNA-dependent DNA polymerase) [Nesidiocoris tenuis]